MLLSLYQTIFYQPVFNLLVWLYNVIPGSDIGVAIVILTIIIKLILFPFSLQSIKAQRSMQSLQPKLDALKKQYKDDREALSREMMSLYRTEKVNPFSSCLPLLIQLPFLWAVFQVFRGELANTTNIALLYSFVADPGTINMISLGFVDLAKPQIVLAVLAGLAQFWQAKSMQVKKPAKDASGHIPAGAKDESAMAMMNKQMMYVMPVLTVVIGASLPGGLALYWLVTTLLMALQQEFFIRRDAKKTALV